MNAALRHSLVEAAKQAQPREVITFLYRDHPQGASYEGLTEMLFLHEAFEESQLTRLVEQGILAFDGTRYTLSIHARQILDRDAAILLDEFLR
jgi:DNA-binding IclR family transcriptional regulator